MTKLFSTNTRILVIVLLLATVAGAGSGVVSSILISRELTRYAATLFELGDFTELEPKTSGIFSLGDDEARERVIGSLERSLVQFTPDVPPSERSTDWVSINAVSGVGVVVSADGWTLTTKDELASFRNIAKDALAWHRGVPHTIERIVGDPLTNYVLVKLTQASGLSPVGFVTSTNIKAGEQVYVGGPHGTITPTSVIEPDSVISEAPTKAENYQTVFTLGSEAGKGLLFAPNGDLIGFALPEHQAIPLAHGREFVDDVIRAGSPTYAAFGAYTADLSLTLNISSELRQGLFNGALLTSVPSGTPASLAGLRPGDIVTAINGEPLTSSTQLSELLSLYEPDQTARFTINRAGVDQEFSVTFANLADLLY